MRSDESKKHYLVSSMKNPEGKQLRIKSTLYIHNDENKKRGFSHVSVSTEVIVLSNLAVAEATLVRAGKQSALPHFIAIVKRIEEICGFTFEIIDQT